MNKVKIDQADPGNKKLNAERDNLRRMRDSQLDSQSYICKFYYDCEDEKNYYFVFEECWGDLKKLQEDRGRMGELEAQRVFHQLAKAMGCLKAQGIVHRDLKPDNIMLSYDFDVRLTDFGLSKYVS